MAMNRERADRRTPSRPGTYWLYGSHAAKAALRNPRRTILRALLTEQTWLELQDAIRADLRIEICHIEKLAQTLPPGSVHQGVALLCEPLPSLDLADVLQECEAGTRRIAVLDQITDPHNEGAILRSAAAFGFTAVVVQSRHSPPETGVLAKAASGALDRVPRISVVNIARALEDLGRLAVWRIALAPDGREDICDALAAGDAAIVLGAEGAGLRRLVRERCDTSAFIPTGGPMESLNVSNAAAIAFYEMARKAGRK
jgi:23S rRNA (guanosine2251-2'-O)-methyltransferase